MKKLDPMWHGKALALIGAAVLAAGTLIVWLVPTADAPVENRATAAASRGAGSGTLHEPATPASQAQLSPLSETVRHPGMATGDVIGRIQQRHAMSGLFADVKDIERARSENALMAPASRQTAISHMGILSERQKSDGCAFVSYDPRTLESRVEGDQLDIFLPGAGVTVKAVVDRVESVDGMLRWTGRILDYQEGGKFSITHALQDNYAVGSFNTPAGNLAMEAKNGWGWVAPQSSDFFLPAGGSDGVPAPPSHPATVPPHKP